MKTLLFNLIFSVCFVHMSAFSLLGFSKQDKLLKAVRKGNVEAASSLIEAGADVNKRTFFNESLLEIAIVNGFLETMKVLLDAKGIHINSKSKKSRSMIEVAIRKGNLEAANILLSYGFNVDGLNHLHETALFYATRKNLLESIKFLLKNKANPNLMSKEGVNPIMLTVKNKSKKTLELLHSKGQGDLKVKNFQGLSLLHIAAEMVGSKDVIEYLVTNGFPVDEKSSGGWTALHYAAIHGKLENATVLLEHGADFFVITKAGYGPYHYMVSSKFDDLKKKYGKGCLSNFE